MSTKPLMLEGLMPETKASDGMLQEWRKEKLRLEEEVRGLRHDLDEAEAKNETLERTVRNLRRQLSPLHNALRAVFGEIELAVGQEDVVAVPTTTGSSPVSDPRWQHGKENFPGLPARVIDALLSQRELTVTQLSGFLRVHYDTALKAVIVLSKAGLVSKESGKGGKVRLNT